MNYLLAENLSKAYGDKILFQDIDLNINKGQKIALIAKNGTGKSSLLKILVGKEPSDKGTILINKNITVGYLDQAPDFDPHDTVFEAIYNSENPVLQVIRQYEHVLLQSELHPTPANQLALEKAMEQMQLLEAWDYEAKIKQILSKFKVDRLDCKTALLSGGEKKRLALACLLIRQPDFLILDEPTNHLDLEMVEWLEEFLGRQNATIFLVTHDRYFLNRVTNEIVEMEKGGIWHYRGNYEYFLEKKGERQENLKVVVDKAQKLMRKELDWIRAQPKARTTKAKSRVDAFEKIRQRASQKTNEDSVRFADIKMNRLGNKILELWHLHKKFGDKKILNDFSYIFKRRDRVGIVGPNGSGKTTLLRMIMNEEKLDEGKIVRGKTVVFGYYTQKGMQLKSDQKVIDVVRDVAEVLPLAKGKYLSAGQLLDYFMFPYSRHHHYVSTLSGGERRRLYLLTILMKNPNFLILDEPTNDLDLLTLNTLEAFLQDFQGCLLIVSHDRYFMDKIVDHLFVFQGDGNVRDFPGHYSHFRAAKQEEERLTREANRLAKEQAPKTTVAKTKNKNTEKVKLSYNEKREYNRLEQEIEQLELEKEGLEGKLNAGKGTHQDLLKWSQRLNEVLTAIDEKSDRWLELSEWA